MIWLPGQSDQSDCAKNSFRCMVLSQPERWNMLHTDTTGGILINRDMLPGRFAVIVSGGAGNGPLFGGYAAPELADAVVAGGSHAAPNAYALYEAGKWFGKDRDILLLYNNFAGDYLNNDMAQELLRQDGVRVESVLVHDDIATAVGENRIERNGRCGVALLIRLAGACRNRVMSLDETVAALKEAERGLTTISVHIDLETQSAVYGAGFSGEPGIEAISGIGKNEMLAHGIDMLLQDLPVRQEEALVLMVNRLRLTSMPDGYISAMSILDYVSEKHPVRHFSVGAFSNITDKYGFDITILRCSEDVASMFDTKALGDGFVI